MAAIHPLEEVLNAPAVDILEAIYRGFRARIDAKGKLAELYLSRHLDQLRTLRIIDRYEWHDKDGKPDFEVFAGGQRIVIECKNVRSASDTSARTKKADRLAGEGWSMVELQKTRSGLDAQGRQTRGYPLDHFDILAACLFNTWGIPRLCRGTPRV
jgi:hypothetical protein